MEKINARTMKKLMDKWEKLKNVDLWGFFGGTIKIGNDTWQVIPMDKDNPKFIKKTKSIK